MQFLNIKAISLMRRLSLDSSILGLFDCRIPHLEHISIIESNQKFCCEFPGIIIKSPQARSIELFGPDGEFVEKVSDALLN